MNSSTDSTDALRQPFIKMHGLQNHFVIVDGRAQAFRPDAETVVRICNPRLGVGADQLVVIEEAIDGDADAFMRLYNVDGREVGACGNATRCVAWLLMEEKETDRVRIQTLAGILDCVRSGYLQVACNMGRLRTGWQDIPLAREMDVNDLNFPGTGMADGVAVNVGNPHVVFFVGDFDSIDIEATASAIQGHPIFPEQVNVGFARRTGPQNLDLVVYERGAGLTMACGSGACAAAWAAHLRGLTGPGPVDVSLPGGTVHIEITEARHAIMTGPVAYSFRGQL